MTRTIRARAPLALITAVALSLVAACGSGDTTPDADGTAATAAPVPDEAGGFPVTLDSAGDPITIDAPPQEIVSLSPTATETLFAVGAGDRVVAVDDNSDYPEQAPRTDLSGYEPNVEAVLGYSPDLVLVSDDTNDIVAGLTAAGVDTLVLPAATTLDEAYDQITLVGRATGHAREAEDVVTGMRADIDAAVASLPQGGEPLTVYHELDPTFFSVTSATFIGDVYEELGVVNIADGVDDPAGDPYPQLSQEFVVAADPDLVLLADSECCGVTPDQVAARPGWSGISAVSTGQVYAVDEDVASRWGPRIAEFVQDVAAHIGSARTATR